MQLLHLSRRFLRPYLGWIALLLALQLVAVIASLYLPSFNADIIDNGVAKGDTNYIVRIGLAMLAVSAIQIVATFAATYLGAQSSARLGRDLRGVLFARVGEFSAQEFAQFGAPTLISRTTNDVTQVQTVVNMVLTMVVSAPIMMIGGIVMALREDLGLSWLLTVAIPVLGITVAVMVLKMTPQFRRMQALVDLVNRILREQITGVRVVRAFVREPFEEARFDEANQQYTDAALRVGRMLAVAMPVIMFVFNASTVAVVWFGARRVDAGEMQVGALTAFMSYLMQILMSVMMATFLSMMIPRAAVSSGRIQEVLGSRPTILATPTPSAMPPAQVAVEFDRVTFRYPGAELPVLREVSFTARPGTMTAVIGSTGAGKTTLLNLVPRLYDASGGSVRVGGVDVRDAAPEQLWSRLGIVPQRPYLFSGTVASNLRYGKEDATDAELWEALEVAQAADFVRAMPGGLEAAIAQGGTNVSGGQRQRLAIARAIVRRPEVYLFDDSFSALDLSTDARLRSALAPITREATVIVVAQRVSTIVSADTIVVLEDGLVVGTGTHTELLAGCPTYAEIVESQQGVTL